ncbi:MAG: glycosyltransferase family 39 protein [Bacteroidetes bacterium]|nr:glycosyltransferase family 39 protein [Bacteroidota bacterium]
MIRSLLQRKSFWYLLFGIVVYFLVFHQLGSHAIYTWDESLFAMRAFYWAHHGTFFTSWSQVDFNVMAHPNTKPPLVSIIQAAFLHFTDYHRIGLRIPIAILGLAAAAAIIRFFSRMGLFATGLVAAVVLLVSHGYNQAHMLRSGDQDVAVSFFLLISILAYHQFWENQDKGPRNLYIFFIFTALAVLTKSIAGFFMLPPLALYTLLFAPWKKLLTNPHFYLGSGLMVLLIAINYGTMEWMKPGFLQMVWDNEIGGRYGKSIDGHVEPWWFYLGLMFSKSFMPFSLFSLAGIFFGLKTQETKIKRLVILLTISIVTYVLVLSAGSTKLYWYLAPVYPLAAILSALGLYGMAIHWLHPLATKKWPGAQPRRVFALAAIALLAWPIAHKAIENSNTHTDYVMERHELALDKIREQLPQIKQISIHTRNDCYPNLSYLANVYQKIYGYQISLISGVDGLGAGDYVLGEYHPRMDVLSLEEIAVFGEIKLYRVQAKRSNG